MQGLDTQELTIFGVRFTFIYDKEQQFVSFLIGGQAVNNKTKAMFENYIDTSELYDYIDQIILDGEYEDKAMERGFNKFVTELNIFIY